MCTAESFVYITFFNSSHSFAVDSFPIKHFGSLKNVTIAITASRWQTFIFSVCKMSGLDRYDSSSCSVVSATGILSLGSTEE